MHWVEFSGKAYEDCRAPRAIEGNGMNRGKIASNGAGDCSDETRAQPRRVAACCLAASALQMFSTMAFNGSLNTAYSVYVYAVRDWATLASALALLGLLALAKRKPRLVHPMSFSAAAVLFVVLGYAAGTAGLAFHSPALIVLGLCAKGIGQAWVCTLWIVACSNLSLANACLTIASGNCSGILLSRFVMPLCPVGLLGLADSLGTIASLALCLPLTRPFFEHLAQTDDPADQEVAHPASFLPMRSHMFLYIFAFNFAYGYGFRFMDGGSALTQDLTSMLGLLAVCAFVIFSRRHPRLDTLFLLPFSLVLIGYLAVLSDTEALSSVASALLVTGSVCFELLTWFALCSAAKRNVIDALPTISWGLAVSYIGIDLGALLAMATGAGVGASSATAQIAIVVVLVAFVLYVVVTRRAFSFDETIEGIAPDAPEVIVRDVDTLETHVENLAVRYALTPRERDVMALLARGNNSQRVEEKLSIKHNTVKFHARNVYAKLGVHSQQELIDLVASDANATAIEGGETAV